MADNTTLDAGSGGDTIATDDIGGVKYQRVKVTAGADGTATDVIAGGGTEASALLVTIASDSTGVLSVDDNGGTLSIDDGGGAITVDGTVTANLSATDNAVLDAIEADTTTIAGAVSGTEMQVDVVTSALPSGAATAANQSTIIGHVDGLEGLLTTIDADTSNLSVVGGGTEATAQRVTIANDSTGVLSVDDNGGSLTVDGTVAVSGTVAVTDNSGSLTVDDGAGSLTVDNAGTFAVQDSQKVADNTAFTDGTTPVQPGGFIYDEVAGTALSENDVAAARINLNRAQVGIIEDGATRGRWATVSASNALKVDGSAVTQPVSGTVTANPASGTITTVTTVSTLTGGGVAHDGADSGNPVKVGMKAGTADITAVANNDRTDMRADTLGHQVVRPYALHENLVSGATAAITTTSSTSVIAAAGAGVRNYITSVLVTNSHATVGTLVTITDGSGGTTLYAGYAAPVGGGFSVTFPTPLRGGANTAVHAVCGTTGSNVYVSASGYKSAV